MTTKTEAVTAYAQRRFNRNDEAFAKGQRISMTPGEYDELSAVGLVAKSAPASDEKADAPADPPSKAGAKA